MKYLLLILSIMLVSPCFGQDIDTCTRKIKLTTSEIKKLPSYRNIRTIKLISFKHEYPLPKSDSDVVRLDDFHIPTIDGEVDFSKMFEVKILNKELSEKLLDILVNHGNKDGDPEIFGYCFSPRNGIVFFDAKGRQKDYLEICFECSHYIIGHGNISVSPFCFQKYAELKDFFQEARIVYGVSE